MEEAVLYGMSDKANNQLVYQLIATSSVISHQSEDLHTVYSILIVRTDYGVETESRFHYDLTRDRGVAENYLKILAEHRVDPAESDGVVDDLLNEGLERLLG